MTEINARGLFLVTKDGVTHIHTSVGEKNLDELREYLDEWDIEL